MGIYDRDWWRDRYNQRTAHNEKRDAKWRKPEQQPKQPKPAPHIQVRPRRTTTTSPSPVGAIIVWTAVIAIVLIIVKQLTR
ncbi:hypothetical protein ACUXAV_006119 [Cupriavidus metallidurans]|uniref:hypothetical protein n=1 Tax=Cupriavidus metallidurans TaxID=119219 RepID=UPI001269F311|nr:hypothetical protein [Cupriavidus metallidurans]MDE4920182.1 hypothetical protein [Cupriavidus metallidurans]